MEKKRIVLVLIVLLLSLFISCSNGTENEAGNGGLNLAGSRWVYTEWGMTQELTFTRSNLTITVLGSDQLRGTYTVSGNIISCTATWVSPLTASFGVTVGSKWTFTLLDEETLRDDDDGTIYKRVR